MGNKCRRSRIIGEDSRYIMNIEEGRMKIVCAWCGGEVGEKEGEGIAGVSHTICKQCSDNLVLTTETNGADSDGYKGYGNDRREVQNDRGS